MKTKGDESEEMRRAAINLKRTDSSLIGGMFEVQFPAPSVPSATSEQSADALIFTKQGKNRRAKQLFKVLACIGSTEAGKTIDELDVALGIGSGSACARISDLRSMGYIDTSETIRRKTRRGAQAAVQFITPKGRERLAENNACAPT